MVPAGAVRLHEWKSTKFRTPDNESPLDLSALFQVAEQCAGWLIEILSMGAVFCGQRVQEADVIGLSSEMEK